MGTYALGLKKTNTASVCKSISWISNFRPSIERKKLHEMILHLVPILSIFKGIKITYDCVGYQNLQQQEMSNIVASCSSYLLYLIRYVKNIFITKYFLLLYFWASYLFLKADITERYFDLIFHARTILMKNK